MQVRDGGTYESEQDHHGTMSRERTKQNILNQQDEITFIQRI